MFGLKQLNLSPTLITYSSSSINDYILESFSDTLTQRESFSDTVTQRESFSDTVTQRKILIVGVFDHQLNYCTKNLQG